MPLTIDCPGRHTFTSRQTRTSWGVFTDSNRRSAIARAQAAVVLDLANQVNNAVCADGCLKQAGQTNAPAPAGASCERKGWSLFIVVRCEATANGSVTIDCVIQG